MAILNNLIVHGSSRFLNIAQFNALKTNTIGADKGVFNKLIATDATFDSLDVQDLTAQNATVVGLLDVKGELHSNSWTNSNIATIDGSFYITPTVSCTSGTFAYNGTSITVTAASGQSFGIDSLYTSTTDGTVTTYTTWPQYSKVLLTGEVKLNGSNEWMPLGTIRGQINSSSTSSIQINSLYDSQGTTPIATLVALGSTSITNATFRNVKVSLYERASSSSSFFPMGIYMTALGAKGKTFIDIYGGGNAKGSIITENIDSGAMASPVLRIGNLSGLPKVGAITPKGWGIYTTNGFFTGTVVAQQGKIGNGATAWTIGSGSGTGSVSYIYAPTNGPTTKTANTIGMYVGTDGINNFKTTSQYVRIYDGKIYAQGAEIDGNIVAQSLTIGNGSSAYNGMAAINISGYDIEIISDSTGVVDSDNTTYLYPHLYHNGTEITTGVNYSHFIWYQDGVEPGTAGDANNQGRYLATYGHNYRVTYDFDDGAVGGGTQVQTRTIDPSKYITKINDTGITIHPEVWTNQSSYIQLTGTGMELFNSSGVSIAQYGSTARIGYISGNNYNINITGTAIDLRYNTNVLNKINSDGMTLYDGEGVLDSNIIAEFGTNGAQIGQNGSTRTEIGFNKTEWYMDNDRLAGALYYSPTESSNSQIESGTITRSNGVDYWLHNLFVSNEGILEISASGNITYNSRNPEAIGTFNFDEYITLEEYETYIWGGTYDISYVGDGTTKSFSLADVKNFAGSIESVYVGGTRVTNYTLNGTTVTFNTAPASGASIYIYPNRYYYFKIYEIPITLSSRTTATFYVTITKDSPIIYCGFSEQTPLDGVSPMEIQIEMSYVSELKYFFTITGEKILFGQSNVNDIVASSTNIHNTLRVGKYSIINKINQPPFVIGNGTANDARSNALSVDWDGNINTAGQVYQTVEQVTPSITTSSGTLNSATLTRCGNLRQLTLAVSKSTATAVGSSVYTGTLTNAADRPITNITGASYFGSSCLCIAITSAGDITVRVTGAQLAANSPPTIGVLYIAS